MKTNESLGFEINPETVQVGNHQTDNVGLVAYGNDGSEWVLPKIMGRSYVPLYNSEFEQLAHDMAQTLDLPEPGFVCNNDGSVVVATIKNPESQKIGLGNDIDIKDHIVLVNPHNGGALSIGTSNVIIRCTNMLSQVFKKVKVSHSGDLNKKVMNFKAEFENYNKMRDKLYQNFNELANKQIDYTYMEQFAKELHGVEYKEDIQKQSKRKQNLIEDTLNSIETETNDIGMNGLGLFNGVTHFVTHKYQNGKNSEKGNLFGQAYRFSENALNKANKELLTD